MFNYKKHMKLWCGIHSLLEAQNKPMLHFFTPLFSKVVTHFYRETVMFYLMSLLEETRETQSFFNSLLSVHFTISLLKRERNHETTKKNENLWIVHPRDQNTAQLTSSNLCDTLTDGKVCSMSKGENWFVKLLVANGMFKRSSDIAWTRVSNPFYQTREREMNGGQQTSYSFQFFRILICRNTNTLHCWNETPFQCPSYIIDSNAKLQSCKRSATTFTKKENGFAKTKFICDNFNSERLKSKKRWNNVKNEWK